MKTKIVLRSFTLKALLVGGLHGFPIACQAQFFELLQSVVGQVQASQAQADAAKQAARAELEAAPRKKWSTDLPAVPPGLQRSADKFAESSTDPELKELLIRLYIEGEHNAVLNLQRIGLTALTKQQLGLAGKAFDAAISRIERIYADNPYAQKAKSLWHGEKSKDFKGEPYERAMAYFYRGLVYAADNDFQNARAMFKQADYQDTVAETEVFGSDFGLMPFMAGWASYCDGDANLAKDYAQQAAKGDPAFAGLNVAASRLVLYETGQVPLKYGAGKYAETLKWHPRSTADDAPTGFCSGKAQCFSSPIVKGGDLNFQATTRGGRPIDGVLAGKASYKDGTEALSSVAGTVGQLGLQFAAQTGSQNAANLGIFGSLASMVGSRVAGAMNPAADIREWEQLPNAIWVSRLVDPLGPKGVYVKMGDQLSDKPLTQLVSHKSCKLFWGRATQPKSDVSEAGPLESSATVNDEEFRQEIATLALPAGQ